MTVLLPYPYSPDAQCPTWERFIGEALKGEVKAIDLVQAFFRLSILPKPAEKYEIEACWDLYGEAGTGKGTVLETLKNVVGRHNCGHFTTKSLGNPNSLAGMLDKPVSICPDDSGHMEDVGQFNRILSNETVDIKLMYKNVMSTTLNTFLVRAYNDFISTPSGSKGLDRRIVAMTFNQKPEVKDEELQSKLNAELAGIFNWAWAISEVEMKRRIRWAGEVEAVAEASVERFLANNPTFVFLQENYPNGQDGVKSRDLYHQYSQWSKDSGRIPLNQRSFSSALKDFGCYQRSKIQGICLWYIPAISNVDIIQTLGITQKHHKDNTQQKEGKLGEKGELLEEPKTVTPQYKDTSEPPEATEDSMYICTGELGAKGAKLLRKSFPIVFSSDDDQSNPDEEIENNTVFQPQPEILEQPPTPSPNPKGVITHTKYLKGEIGAVKIQFKTKALAKEWRDLIDLIFGYNPEIKANIPAVNGYKWRVYCEKFDRDALTRLERKDLSKSPPNRE